FVYISLVSFFFFSSRRRHTRSKRDWSSDVCSSDLLAGAAAAADRLVRRARRDPHPAVPGGHRQLRLVELADDPGGVLRDQRFLPALGRGRAVARLGMGALAGGRRTGHGRGLAAVVAAAGPGSVRRARGALVEAAAEPVLRRSADERELRPLPPGQRLRRLRFDDGAAV